MLKVNIIVILLTCFKCMNGDCLLTFFQINCRNFIDVVPVMPLSHATVKVIKFFTIIQLYKKLQRMR
jgi:hypothetical protein